MNDSFTSVIVNIPYLIECSGVCVCNHFRSSQRRSDASSSTFHQHHHSLDDSRDDSFGEQYTTFAR